MNQLINQLLQKAIQKFHAGSLNESEDGLKKILMNQPKHFDALHIMGVIRGIKQHHQEALDYFKRALKIDPNHGHLNFNIAKAYSEVGQDERALKYHLTAIRIDPNVPEWWLNYGKCLLSLKKPDQAIIAFERALELHPNYAEAYTNLGCAHMELKSLAQALASFDRALQINSNLAEAWSGRGNVLLEFKNHEESLASYGKAININPKYAEAWYNRGNALLELKKFEESLESYDKAILINPQYAEAFFNKSIIFLLNGNFELGWQFYEWRWKQKIITSQKRNFIQPIWLGNADISGKIILLHAEQGLGDVIQFCRYASLVKSRGAKVILEVPQVLFNLLKSLNGVDILVKSGSELPDFDYHCPLLSLPLALNTRLESIPSPTPYLKVNASKSREWADKLGERKKLRLGIAWSSLSNFKNDHLRSMRFSDFINCLPEDDFEIICLQKEIKPSDQDFFEKTKIKIGFFGPELKDFSDTAGLASCLDLVISTCTSVPHMTAALGIPTWILLSYVPDYRWMLDREDSPWYRTAKLYRQQSAGDWDGVINRVKRDLERFKLGELQFEAQRA